MGLFDRLAHAWNAFSAEERRGYATTQQLGLGSATNPSLFTRWGISDRSLVDAIYSRIANDVSVQIVKEVIADDNDRFTSYVKSGLTECLSVEANVDQTGRELIRDICWTLFDDGVAAVVPVDTTMDPTNTGTYEINSLRVGRVTNWYPAHVAVSLYNEKTGERKEITVPKKICAIVQNPHYDVMNKPLGTMSRLTEKLSLLDKSDRLMSSGKIDMILQLPYVVKNERRVKDARNRVGELEKQLKDSTYGVAYVDGTERITQLNRPVENTLFPQIEYLTNQLYDMLGITAEVFKGTAEEAAMLNYYQRTIRPILDAIVEEMTRKFITKNARTRGHRIMYFRDPFQLVPVSSIADIADKFTRNAILTTNEVRGIIGMAPVADPMADELSNKNLPADQQPGAFDEDPQNESLEEDSELMDDGEVLMEDEDEEVWE